MIKIGKSLAAAVLVLFISTTTISCSLFDSVFAGKVVTTQDNVREEFKGTEIPVPEGAIPKEESDKLKEAGKTPVIVDRGAVKDDTKAIEITGVNRDFLGTALELGIDTAKVLFPGVAILEVIGLLISQRKRTHYGQAVKAIVPYDGKVEVGEAIVSLGRALGLTHSSVATKVTFEKETDKADKAHEKADNPQG
jgi:hypothetical protein